MKQNLIARYGLAVLAIGIALTLRELLRPFLGSSNPYHTIWAAIVFAAWYCGLGPSILAAVIGAAGAWYLFVAPYYSFAFQSRADIVGMMDFLFLSGFIVGLGEIIRRTEFKKRRAERELQRAEAETRTARRLAYEELERLVAERTKELNESNQHLRHLSARLMRVQDEERRKIARELHDSAGQYLAAVSMAIDAAGKEQSSPTAIRKLQEAAELTRICTSEIRTISHLLHPPLLEELGLLQAIRWYVEGFSSRCGIQVGLTIPEDMDRLGEDVELVLFRVLQESLTNIHRHSGSRIAYVRVVADSQQVWLEVRDEGKGQRKGNGNGNGSDSSRPFRSGIGTTGMRERVRDVAGTLEIISSESGTLVKAMIPRCAAPETGVEAKAASVVR